MQTLNHFYLVASAILFLLLFIVWSKKTALNVSFKIALFFLGVIGIILELKNLGYIVNSMQ